MSFLKGEDWRIRSGRHRGLSFHTSQTAYGDCQYGLCKGWSLGSTCSWRLATHPQWLYSHHSARKVSSLPPSLQKKDAKTSWTQELPCCARQQWWCGGVRCLLIQPPMSQPSCQSWLFYLLFNEYINCPSSSYNQSLDVLQHVTEVTL